MKSILISINPKWCEKIASGEKTVEVRKTRPKLETPFKVYIHCTQDKKFNFCTDNGEQYTHIGNGKVIGEFLCDKIFDICIEMSEPDDLHGYPFPCTGLTDKEILQYLGNGKTGYGWHISDLVIYDKPRELDEFNILCTRNGNAKDKKCVGCQYLLFDDCPINGYTRWCGVYKQKPITRPPQSWCYVEEVQA